MGLREQLVRLGTSNRGLRRHIRPILAEIDGNRNSADMGRAEQEYIEKRHLVDQELDALHRNLEGHGGSRITHAHANEMGYVLDRLREINQFLD